MALLGSRASFVWEIAKRKRQCSECRERIMLGQTVHPDVFPAGFNGTVFELSTVPDRREVNHSARHQRLSNLNSV